MGESLCYWQWIYLKSFDHLFILNWTPVFLMWFWNSVQVYIYWAATFAIAIWLDDEMNGFQPLLRYATVSWCAQFFDPLQMFGVGIFLLKIGMNNKQSLEELNVKLKDKYNIMRNAPHCTRYYIWYIYVVKMKRHEHQL